MPERNIRWRFAPTMGGAEQGTNPGQQHFAAQALAAMVRETLQNSLDHHDGNLPPVQMTYRLDQVDPQDVNAQQLAEHIRACMEEARGNPEAERRFARMLETLGETRMTCLAAIDANTTGLQGTNWENLIFREGIPGNEGSIARGGSFGFGKNAPFNLSGCGAVIYSTRHLRSRQGKVTRMAGRAQLRSHTSPQGAERLQNIGFLAGHQPGNWNQPITGPEIPHAFRLKESGAGVYILGFNQREYPDWPQQIARAAVSQFFPAIHMEKLTISIQDGMTARKISRQTLEEEIEALQDRRTRYYHQAFREADTHTTRPSGRLDGMGEIRLWVSTDPDAPNRLAHINRRGMLITDSRERRENPLYPRGGTGWQGWCAVTMADDEKTDAFLRRMEPPAHDAIQPAQLPDQYDRRNAIQELEEHRSQIRSLVRSLLDQNNRKNSTNVEELAKLFPITNSTAGRDLNFQEEKVQARTDQTIEIEEERNPGEPPQDRKDRETPDPTREHQEDPPAAAATLRRARILRSGPKDLVMAFTTPDGVDEIRFSLRTAGEQYQRNENPVGISEVVQVGDITTAARLDGQEIVVTAPPETRVKLMIVLDEDDESYQSYRLALARRAA